MRKWIGIIAVIAMFMTAVLPMPSHAFTVSEHKEESSSFFEAAEHEEAGCDHHAQYAQQDQKSPHNKPCCDQGACKCINGSCYGGLAQIPGNENNGHFPLTTKNIRVAAVSAFTDAAVPDRLKRPPRA